MIDQKELQFAFGYAEHVLMTDMDGEKVLMSMETGKFVELNATGREIWELLDGKRQLSEIVELLRSSFNVPSKECAADVLAFIRDLRAANLIKDAE